MRYFLEFYLRTAPFCRPAYGPVFWVLKMTNTKVAVTLSNSIIGVSILAMPFCMEMCGVILGAIMLILNSLLTRFTCHLLLKSAVVSRKMTFEFIANHTFGQLGKLAVELNIIGFMLGILISFFVIIGDLAPAFTAGLFQIENTSTLRFVVLFCFGFGAALPLAMLREIDSLAHISMISILFYITLALKTITESIPMFIVGDWSYNINLWKPSGILQSLPIFALALSCQTQIFEIYDSLPEPSLKHMNSVVKLAVNLCTGLYLTVGIFGYVANCDKDFTGNILMHFTPGFSTEAIKILFVLAVALSFPMVVFPCRTSIHSLLFKRNGASFEFSGNYIPEVRFKIITFVVIVSTLFIGILCPNIEIVLGLVGSTIGILTCIIFPALMFVQLISKHTFEKWGAQMVLVIGIVFLVSCTCASLNSLINSYYEVEHKNSIMIDVEKTDLDASVLLSETTMSSLKIDENVHFRAVVTRRPSKYITFLDQPVKIKSTVKIVNDVLKIGTEYKEQKTKASDENGHKRQEPPNPQEPDNHLNADKYKDMVLGIVDQRIDVKANEISMIPNVNVRSPAAGIAKILEDNSKALQHQEEILRKLEVQQQQQKELLDEQREILKELKAHEKTHDSLPVENLFKDMQKKEHTKVMKKTKFSSQNVEEKLDEENKAIPASAFPKELHENRTVPFLRVISENNLTFITTPIKKTNDMHLEIDITNATLMIQKSKDKNIQLTEHDNSKFLKKIQSSAWDNDPKTKHTGNAMLIDVINNSLHFEKVPLKVDVISSAPLPDIDKSV